MLMSTQFWLAYTRAFAYAYAYTVSENQAGLTPAAHYSVRNPTRVRWSDEFPMVNLL